MKDSFKWLLKEIWINWTIASKILRFVFDLETILSGKDLAKEGCLILDTLSPHFVGMKELNTGILIMT